MDTLPICKAKSKQSGVRCKNFATKGKSVCRIHGGMVPKHNPGPKTPEGKLRQKMASWKHGMRSKEVLQEAKELREMIKAGKQTLESI